ncbi:MAG: hypothetical protein CSB15_00330 [Clostridiales bacterium]|nr:MAG: hypothetical protein CSB15_00330 [Clostridiales bacterium]
MKKRIIIGVVLFFMVLLIPFKTISYDDGGTRTFTSLTYKAIFWNEVKENNPNAKNGLELLIFPNNFKSLNTIKYERGTQKYKTIYVGDNSKVVSIVSNQKYPKGYVYDYVEIHSNTEPYGLTVFLKGNFKNVKEQDFNKNAENTFRLIGNLSYIKYVKSNNKEIIARFKRNKIR